MSDPTIAEARQWLERAEILADYGDAAAERGCDVVRALLAEVERLEGELAGAEAGIERGRELVHEAEQDATRAERQADALADALRPMLRSLEVTRAGRTCYFGTFTGRKQQYSDAELDRLIGGARAALGSVGPGETRPELPPPDADPCVYGHHTTQANGDVCSRCGHVNDY